MFPFTTAAIEDDAVVTSDWSARLPDESVAAVRVRVPYAQTFAAVSPPLDTLDTATSRLSTISFPMVPGLDKEAVVMFQTAAGIPVIVAPSTPNCAASDEEAASTVAFVFVLIFDASEVEAARIALLVLPFMAVSLFDIAAPSELDAVVTSDWRASVPEVRVPAVSVRVAALQISAAIAVPEVRVRVPDAQISATSVPNEVRVRAE